MNTATAIQKIRPRTNAWVYSVKRSVPAHQTEAFRRRKLQNGGKFRWVLSTHIFCTL